MGTKRVGWARIRSLINENLNQLKILKPQQITVDDTRLLAASESGATLVWKQGTTHHITLPSATVGLRYNFLIKKGSGSAHTIITQTADKIYGRAILVKFGAADKCSAQQIEKLGSTVDKIHFKNDETTRGGRAGDVVELICVEAGFWLANVRQTTDANPAAAITVLAN